MEESQREQALASKGSTLVAILEKLKKIKASECREGEECEQEGSNVRELKSSIRYLIGCELEDINETVKAACGAVSRAFQEDKHFYLAVEQFVRIADKQLEKHREVGRELLSLVGAFTQREKDIRLQLRSILVEWVA
jgi:hypothetical protein